MVVPAQVSLAVGKYYLSDSNEYIIQQAGNLIHGCQMVALHATMRLEQFSHTSYIGSSGLTKWQEI